MFLQILGSLGDYIKSNRGNSHPKTFKTLTSVFAGLEKVVSQTDMAEIEKKKVLQVELKRYNGLRGLIQQQKSKVKQTTSDSAGENKAEQVAKSGSPQPQEPPVAGPPPDGQISLQTLMAAIDDLKAFVQSELEALRKELVQ